MENNTINEIMFVLVRWPESQQLIEYPWFDTESFLAEHKNDQNAGYFIPKKRYEEYSKDKHEKLKRLNSGACIQWDGNYCKSGEFTSRMQYSKSKHKPTAKDIEAIKKLPYTEINTISDINNPDIHEWYEVGETKHGRVMYCPKTKIKRGLTMGEFYQTSTVD
jgi:hypothetical protein